ncbi:hypothetical protein [Sulfurimonas sp. NWX367]|uniref:hypothetical protein n=1 Tax=Sulfurimonas sp. NWX367 TaxID=2925413 RepID=UPI0032046C56
MKNKNTKENITKYINDFLKHKRALYRSSYKIFKEKYAQTTDATYIFKQRRELARYKRSVLRKNDISKLSNFIQKVILADDYFLADYGKKSLSKKVGCFEWLNDEDTPMYSFELLLTNIIHTKQSLNEFDKGIVFEREKEKIIFHKSISNINNLTKSKKDKLTLYARLENRQELLSYLMNENFIKELDIDKELLHLNNISLMNKQKIIRSFKYYLNSLFIDKSIMKKDLTNKQRVDNLFRKCIEYFLDNGIEFEHYYDETAHKNSDKIIPEWATKIQLPRVRTSSKTQSFNFHNIKFSYFL